MFNYKIEVLNELEKLSNQGLIDLYYGDESHVCSEGYVPYGWQFPQENVYVPSQKGFRLNIFGLINRENDCHWTTRRESIDTKFIVQYIDSMSFKIHKNTFIVLDNASIHTSKLFRERLEYWQTRGLYIFLLPPYSPHYNIAETLWRKLKTEWLTPEDYFENDKIAYATNRCLANVGTNLFIHFSKFNTN